MCGVRARTAAASSVAGRAGSRRRSAGVDLLGVGRLRLVLLGELEPALGREVERPDQQLAAEPGQGRGERLEVCVGADRHLGAERHGPGVEPGGQLHHADAGAGVAGHDRPLDRRRAAPARQQRGVHVQHQVLGEQRLADQLTEGADDDRARARRRRSAPAPPRR